MSNNIESAINEFNSSHSEIVELEDEKVFIKSSTSNKKQKSVKKVYEVFEEYDSLVDDDRVIIPLLDTDSSKITGEYILYIKNTLVPCYAYKNKNTGELERLKPEKIDDTVFSKRLQHWLEIIENENKDTVESSPKIARDNRNIKTQSFFEFAVDSVHRQRETKRDEVREAYRNLQLDSVLKQYGGVKEAIPLNKYTQRKESSYTFVIPQSEDLRTEYRLYPRNEVIIDVTDLSQFRSLEQYEDVDHVEGEITDISGNRVSVTVFSQRSGGQAERILSKAFSDKNAKVTIIPLLNPIPFNRELKAIRTIEQTTHKKDVLVGKKSPSFSSENKLEFPNLNKYQKRAAIKAIKSNSFALIHGPPGTGKTRTLVEIVRKLVSEGNKVLVCTHSNQAIDNLIIGSSSLGDTDANSLHYDALYNDMTISRVGSGSKNDLVEANYGNVNSSLADVVATTMSSADNFSTNSFDVAIIDEASQASIPSTLIPVDKAHKCILAGDHKQLPPYASSELMQDEIEVSLFEHLIELYGSDICTMLRTQYRMNNKIAEFPSKEFYDDKLKTHSKNYNWTLNGLEPVIAFDCEGAEEETMNKSYKNSIESLIVAEQVDALLNFGVSPDEIGIITAYSGQVQQIEDTLEAMDTETRKIKIDTIDSFQGSEREAIIVSFVRSNKDGNTGFLTQPEEGKRRLNVAITRAKKRLVLIGDWQTLKSPTEYESCSETYKNLYDWLEENAKVREYRRKTIS